jgi:hypothetical protein
MYPIFSTDFKDCGVWMWSDHHHHHHRHKHQGLDPLIPSVSRVTTALANVSLVFQLFFFLVVCSNIISKKFSLVAFFASVKTSSVCIHLSCLVCIQSVVHGVRSRLFCGHKGCSLLEVSVTSFLPLQFFISVRLSESNFLTYICGVISIAIRVQTSPLLDMVVNIHFAFIK